MTIEKLKSIRHNIIWSFGWHFQQMKETTEEQWLDHHEARALEDISILLHADIISVNAFCFLTNHIISTNTQRKIDLGIKH